MQSTADRKFLQLFKEDTKMPEYYYNVPSAGALTKEDALKEYRSRTQPHDRCEWIDDDGNHHVGIMWQGNFGSVETIRFADMTEKEKKRAGLKPSVWNGRRNRKARIPMEKI